VANGTASRHAVTAAGEGGQPPQAGIVDVSLCAAADFDHSPTDFRRLLRAGVENDVPGRFKPSFDAECAEWRRPDREVGFRRYNSFALEAFLDLYRQKQVCNLTSRCCSTVALSLDAAVEGALGKGPLGGPC